jgi:putative oxidoreductase
MADDRWNVARFSRITYFLLRVVSGLLILQSGGQKMLDWFGGIPAAALTTQTEIGGVLELVGGPLIMLGLFTRPVAFILSGMMAVAYWQFHAPMGAWPAQNQGMPAVLLCFIFLYMSTHGGGDWSLDALRRRKRGVAT